MFTQGLGPCAWPQRCLGGSRRYLPYRCSPANRTDGNGTAPIGADQTHVGFGLGVAAINLAASFASTTELHPAIPFRDSR